MRRQGEGCMRERHCEGKAACDKEKGKGRKESVRKGQRQEV